MVYVGLAALALVIGCVGTVIGAGGGFLLMPVLLLLYPRDEPETLASISLAAVFFNAASGTIAYLRQRRVDVRAAVRFSLAAAPGSVLGAVAVARLPRSAFELILGVVLVVIGGFLLVWKGRRAPGGGVGEPSAADELGPRVAHRVWLGVVSSFFVGFASSLLGIGGGIIHVPILVHGLGFPVHIATATSHFVLAVTAGVGTATHAAGGVFRVGWRRTLALAAGAMLGAQLGAVWARRAAPRYILRGLAVGLLAVGVRMVVHAARGM